METSPNSHSHSSSSSSSNSQTPLPIPSSPKHVPTRSDPPNHYPTTFVQANTASFKQVVQMLTGSPSAQAHLPDPPARPTHNIPPIKSIPKKPHSSSSSSGFKLYERRTSLKHLKINPFVQPGSGFSPRKPPEILSPSLLDFPSLALSPVTPLIPDPFARSSPTVSTVNLTPIACVLDKEAEEKAIKEKSFYLHRSPVTTPREAAAEPPRLLPLFPVSSPRAAGSYEK